MWRVIYIVSNTPKANVLFFKVDRQDWFELAQPVDHHPLIQLNAAFFITGSDLDSKG